MPLLRSLGAMVGLLLLVAASRLDASAASSSEDSSSKSKGSSPPHSVHLEVTDDPSTVLVWWMTSDPTPNSVVQYNQWPKNLKSTAVSTGPPVTYYEPKSKKYESDFIHVVILRDLPPTTKIHYRVGHDSTGWSEVMTFKTRGAKLWEPVEVLVLADQHWVTSAGKVVDYIAKEDKHYSLSWLLGDISYANGKDQTKWDKHAKLTEPIYSRNPVMAIIGNHEKEFGEYQAYDYRWRHASDPDEQYWWSVTEGSLHMFSLSSEHPINPNSEQYKWLERNLAAANDPKQRIRVPWIVGANHKPAYTSGEHGEHKNFRGHLDPLLRKYNVNLMLYGHDHNYERSFPVNGGKQTSDELGGLSDPYEAHVPFNINLEASRLDTIHVVLGTAGRKLRKCKKIKNYSATGCIKKHGYGILKVNRRKLEWSFVNTEDGEVDDYFKICSTPGCGFPPSAWPLVSALINNTTKPWVLQQFGIGCSSTDVCPFGDSASDPDSELDSDYSDSELDSDFSELDSDYSDSEADSSDNSGSDLSDYSSLIQTIWGLTRTAESLIQTFQGPVQATQGPVLALQSVASQNPVLAVESPMQTINTPTPTAQSPIQTTESLSLTTQTLIQATENLLQATQTLMTTAQSPIQTAKTPTPTQQTPIQATENPLRTAQTPIATTQSPSIQTIQTPIATSQGPTPIAESPMLSAQGQTQTTQIPTPTAEAPIASTQTPIPPSP